MFSGEFQFTSYDVRITIDLHLRAYSLSNIQKRMALVFTQQKANWHNSNLAATPQLRTSATPQKVDSGYRRSISTN